MKCLCCKYGNTEYMYLIGSLRRTSLRVTFFLTVQYCSSIRQIPCFDGLRSSLKSLFLSIIVFQKYTPRNRFSRKIFLSYDYLCFAFGVEIGRTGWKLEGDVSMAC